MLSASDLFGRNVSTHIGAIEIAPPRMLILDLTIAVYEPYESAIIFGRSFFVFSHLRRLGKRLSHVSQSVWNYSYSGRTQLTNSLGCYLCYTGLGVSKVDLTAVSIRTSMASHCVMLMTAAFEAQYAAVYVSLAV